ALLGRRRGRGPQADALRRPQLVTRRPGSRRRALDAGAAFVAAKRPALIPVAEWIGWKLSVGGERRGGMLLGAALRPIAEAEGGGGVPPAAPIVGTAVEEV